MTTEQLLYPRYKVTAPWPGMHMEPFSVGQIVTLKPYKEDGAEGFIHVPVKHEPRNYLWQSFFDLFPHLFQPLPWWSDREVDDMPEYVKITGVGCTIEKDGIAKVLGAGFFEDNGKNIGNEGQPYLLIADKYIKEHGHTRLNCRNCVPATLTEYEAYQQSKQK